MRTNRRIGHNPLGATPSGILIKFAGIKPDNQDFIQPGAVANDRRVGVLWKSADRRSTDFQVIGFDDMTTLLPFGYNEQVAPLGTFVAAGLIAFRFGGFGRQTRSRTDNSK